MVSLLDILGGSAADTRISSPSIGAFTGLPRLQLLQSLGVEPRRITRQEAESLGPFGSVKVRLKRGKKGRKKNAYYAVPSAQEIERGVSNFETRRIQREQESFDKLQNSPFFQGLTSDATSALRLAFNRNIGRTLGQSAGLNLNLADPNVRARILGPQVVSAELALDANRRQAANIGRQLVTGSSLPGITNPQPLTQFQGLTLNALGLQNQNNQFNASQASNAGALNAGIASGLLNSLIGVGGQIGSQLVANAGSQGGGGGGGFSSSLPSAGSQLGGGGGF